MTQEEKAKAYDKAIEKIKYVMGHGVQPVLNKEDLQDIFPELAESEDERISREITEFILTHRIDEPNDIEDTNSWLAWLEKQGKKHSAIRWYDVSLIPQETEELLVEWDSEDATWHEIAFYHADTKTFWDGERQVENVTRWCYIDDIIEQAPKPKWSEEDEGMMNHCIGAIHIAGKRVCNSYTAKDKEQMNKWLKSLKQRMGGEE